MYLDILENNNIESIGKVYAVYCDNGKEYEDNFFDVEAIFSTMQDAVRCIESLGLIEEIVPDMFGGYRSIWRPAKYECEKGNSSCYDCPIYEDCENWEECFDSRTDDSYWYITEFDLLKTK